MGGVGSGGGGFLEDQEDAPPPGQFDNTFLSAGAGAAAATAARAASDGHEAAPQAAVDLVLAEPGNDQLTAAGGVGSGLAGPCGVRGSSRR